MNILLINPYLTGATRLESSAPLGLLALISYAREYAPECNIDFLDLIAHSENTFCQTPRGDRMGPTDVEIREMVSGKQYDLIGVTCMFTGFVQDSYEAVDLFRELYPDAFIIMGGAHISYAADDVLEQTSVDAVVLNEGEITFVDLIQALRNDRPLSDVQGIAFKDSITGDIVQTLLRPNYQHLDDLPRFAYDLYDFDFYSKSMIKACILKGKRVGFLFTSRGCPYDCVFCSTKVMWTRKWRAQSAERVFEDIRYLHEEFDVDEFIINDDSFIVDRKRVECICDMIIESGYKISLHIQSGVTIWLLTERLLEKMVKAGLYRIRLPVETGSEKTLLYVNKPVDLKKTMELIPFLHRLGLWVNANFIIGFPEETEQEMWETIHYAERSTIDDINYLIAQPYAGADMYQDFKDLGLLQDVKDQSNNIRTLYDTTMLNAHQIQALKSEADKRFTKLRYKRLISPKFWATTMWPKINSVDKFKYATRIAKSILSVVVHNIVWRDNQNINPSSGVYKKSRKIRQN